MGKMYLNIIHRADNGERSREALSFQLDAAHRLGLKVTTLVSYQGFTDPLMLQFLREQRDLHGDELGIHLHELMCDDFKQRFDSHEPAMYLQPKEKKAAILAYLFQRFKEEFGGSPVSIGSYISDAWTLRYLKENHPNVQVAISNCFEEGVKMYHGNNHNWCLFSDGGPWGPFHPSKDNALCPAGNEADDIGIVALPHLNRDMIHAITGRDDLMSSHPINLFRGKINEGDECPYWFRFTDEWIKQVRLNGWSYYSFFVSSPWLMADNIFTDDHLDARRFYVKSLEYFARKRRAGWIEDLRMGEFASRFRQISKPGEAQACHWPDVLTNSHREIFWFANSHFRAAIDLVAGGSLCDLRPYCGRKNGDLGPDTVSLWNGNYPFLASAELRGGHGRNHFACTVRIGETSRSILDYRLSAQASREGSSWTLKIEPVELRVGQHTVTLASTFRFDESGTISVDRQVVSCSAAEVTVREEFRGSWGTTEYPEDMRGILLLIEEFNKKSIENSFDYQGRLTRSNDASAVIARIPQVNCELVLTASQPDSAETITGVLFDPGYTLALEKKLAVGETFSSQLLIKRLTP